MPDERYDLELTPGDIGQLENRERLIAFFARLGYNVDTAAKTPHSALGLDSDDLKHQVLAAYRLAADPVDEEIVVYLFEVRSVTKALIEAVSRPFGGRGGSPLLVLTRDYEQFDFVLVLPQKRAPGRDGVLRYGVETRSIKVDRRNVSTVHLRVLKRFTFTETDAPQQWDKLVAAFTYATTASEFFNNRALFSDYYLTHRLTDGQLTPEWREEDQARFIARAIQRLLVNARERLAGRPQSVVWQELYEPLFRELYLLPESQAHHGAATVVAQPDYLLFDPDDRSTALAAALVYPWDRNLDDADSQRDRERGAEIPGARVVSVLADAGVSWAIVTNGKVWRLYAANADNRATNYYEIDLEEALASIDQLSATKYWWLFFRREAFTGFLDRMLKESAEYAKGLRERLKDRVFEDVFARFAEGFILHGRARGQEPSLEDTFSGTMTFLYRLMFILYAESLGLLPEYEARGYGEKSMARLKQEIALAGGNVEDQAPDRLAKAYGPDRTALYDRLAGLFTAIDQGDAGLNLPRYNGGLFSATTPAGSFLATHVIPDRQLALGLDRLCRDLDDKTHALVMVDFKTLGVRELGSIYEGLLEFKLRLAAETLAVVREDGKEVYLPLDKTKGKRVVQTLAPGDVYLENDKRERKASGSYYTPDYIVKYIVAHTVGPVLRRKFEALRPRLEAAQGKYRKHKKHVLTNGNLQPPELFWKDEAMTLLADDCLDVKVLDPAMGSGHFLVEAVDFVSSQLIDFLNGWSENPVWALLARTQEDILADMVRQGVTIDKTRLTRVNLLKRAVLKRCIYGVDLNEMAVELSKLSLWLDAFTLGAPLSFLDHHLKNGNSLIGVRIKDVEDALRAAEAEQLGLLEQSQFAGVMLATDLMRQVGYLSDNTVSQLEESRRQYELAVVHLAPYKRMLDVYTSRWFGNHPNLGKAKAFDPTIAFLKRDDAAEWLNDPTRTFSEKDYMDARGVAATTLRVAQEKRFFHWELEFPEVFFAASRPGGQDVELREGAGFDAVVGNPPYDVLAEREVGRTLSEELRYYSDGSCFKPAMGRKVDLYRLFIARAGSLISLEGYMGFIVPMSLMGDQQTRSLRNHIVNDLDLHLLHAFPQKDDPHRRVFFEAKLPVMILVVCKSTSVGAATLTVHPGKLMNEYDERVVLSRANLQTLVTALDAVPLVKKHAEAQILLKLHSPAYRRVGDLVSTYQGEINETTHRNYLSEDSKCGPRIYRGGNIQRYEFIEEAKQGSELYIDEPKFIASSSADKSVHGRERRIGYQRKAALDNWRRLIVSPLPQPSYAMESISYYFDTGTTSWLLLALLNSQLLEWRFELTSTNNMVSAEEVAKLPAPALEYQELCGADRQRLVELIAAYKRNDTPDVSKDVNCSILVLADFVAFLAQQMVDRNQRKQTEVQRFLTWLESRLHIRPNKAGASGIDSLPGKTILQNYLGDYQKGERARTWDEFYDRLFRNRRRFGVVLADVKGEIEAEYEKSLAVLLPIKEQLAATDNLIDQIVYRLYDLTEEEIAIIERPVFEQALAGAKAAVARDKELQADPDRALAEMADRMRAAGERVVNQLSLAEERKRLDKALPGWNLFPDDVSKALLTGEYSIRSMPDGLDFSGTVVEYAKAVEAAIYHRIFLRFRAEAGCTADDVQNEKVFKPFMTDPDKKITLGSFAALFSSKEKALHAFVRRIYGRADETIYGKGGVLSLLGDQALVEIRNAASHDKVLDREAAKAMRAWAFAVLRNL
jgi:hypothetical protein